MVGKHGPRLPFNPLVLPFQTKGSITCGQHVSRWKSKILCRLLFELMLRLNRSAPGSSYEFLTSKHVIVWRLIALPSGITPVTA